MTIYYSCAHCQVEVGTLTDIAFDINELGIHILTTDEMQAMVSHDEIGNTYIKTICEECYKALQSNPLLYQQDYFIH